MPVGGKSNSCVFGIKPNYMDLKGVLYYSMLGPDLVGLTVAVSYSLFQKKRTFNSDFFCGPPGGGGPKIHMVDYVNGSELLPPPPSRAATKKFRIKCAFLLE